MLRLGSVEIIGIGTVVLDGGNQRRVLDIVISR